MIKPLVLNDTGYYTIDTSEILYTQIVLEPTSALIIHTAHTNFYKNQNWSIRVWVSNVPNGVSVTREPVQSRSYVSPLKTPIRFGLYDYAYPHVPELADVIWFQPASPELTYYVNIQNRETRPNAFYLKVDTAYL